MSQTVSTTSADPALSRLHVLLADDQIINAMIIAKLLSLLGCTMEHVEDGAQAVERWQQGRFDLILMDVQMPVLDGLEATARIRALERSGSKSGHVPVVALTASAAPEDRERSLAAGMDTHLSKPITLDSLAQAMRAAIANHPLPATPPPVPTVIDLSRLLESLGGAEELLAEFIEAMQVELRQRMTRLHEAGLASNATQACAQAHALRGALGSVGAAKAAALTRKLENSARANEWTEFQLTLAQLKDELRGIESALAAIG